VLHAADDEVSADDAKVFVGIALTLAVYFRELMKKYPAPPAPVPEPANAQTTAPDAPPEK
jgi:hypothetical protein